MTMKSVSPADEEEKTLDSFEIAQRKRARSIFEKVFPGVTATPQLIEEVSQKIVVTDADAEIDEEETEAECGNLLAARSKAPEMYGDDSPAATLLAYDAIYDSTEAERWTEVNDKLDLIVKSLGKKARK